MPSQSGDLPAIRTRLLSGFEWPVVKARSCSRPVPLLTLKDERQTSASLSPATPDEVTFAISYPLRHKGKKTFTYSGESMAKITTEHLVESLRQGGFVIMKQPPRDPGPSTHGPLGIGYKAHLTE